MRVRPGFSKAKGLLAKDLHLLMGEVERWVPTLPSMTISQFHPDLKIHWPGLLIVKTDRLDLLAAYAKGRHLACTGLQGPPGFKFSPAKKKVFLWFWGFKLFLFCFGVCQNIQNHACFLFFCKFRAQGHRAEERWCRSCRSWNPNDRTTPYPR